MTEDVSAVGIVAEGDILKFDVAAEAGHLDGALSGFLLRPRFQQITYPAKREEAAL